jgi:hypothetical protein
MQAKQVKSRYWGQTRGGARDYEIYDEKWGYHVTLDFDAV